MLVPCLYLCSLQSVFMGPSRVVGIIAQHSGSQPTHGRFTAGKSQGSAPRVHYPSVPFVSLQGLCFACRYRLSHIRAGHLLLCMQSEPFWEAFNSKIQFNNCLIDLMKSCGPREGLLGALRSAVTGECWQDQEKQDHHLLLPHVSLLHLGEIKYHWEGSGSDLFLSHLHTHCMREGDL